MAQDVVLTIDSVGVRGDGVAQGDGKPVYVPFAAPGDRVRVRLSTEKGERRGQLVELLAPGARIAPVCAHFGACGGALCSIFRPRLTRRRSSAGSAARWRSTAS